jgi:hypothetical protein
LTARDEWEIMKHAREPESFRLPFSEISEISATEALRKIRNRRRVQIGELRVIELIVEDNKPQFSSIGVYVFFSENNTCLYVGKNQSQHFIERIPRHLVLNEDAWMNYLLRRLRIALNLPSLGHAALAAMECTLLLIPVEKVELIVRLEKFLRLFLEPEFNKYSQRYRARYRNIDLSQRLGDLVTKI